jgi:hypothetical protein
LLALPSDTEFLLVAILVGFTGWVIGFATRDCHGGDGEEAEQPEAVGMHGFPFFRDRPYVPASVMSTRGSHNPEEAAEILFALPRVSADRRGISQVRMAGPTA